MMYFQDCKQKARVTALPVLEVIIVQKKLLHQLIVD